MEKWLDISECPTYEVSDEGRVRFKKTGKILKPDWTNKGYAKVALWNGEKYLKRYIHRLVAIAFIPNPDELAQVNHIDEDKSNNCVNNLEWCSQDYNIKYSNPYIDMIGRSVLQFDLDGNLIKEFHSLVAAEKEVGVAHTQIANAADGFTKQSGGFIWKWKK